MSCEICGKISPGLYPVDDDSIFYSEPSVNSRKLVKSCNVDHERFLLGEWLIQQRLWGCKFAEDPRKKYGTLFEVENVKGFVHHAYELTIIESFRMSDRTWYNVGISSKKPAWVFVKG